MHRLMRRLVALIAVTAIATALMVSQIGALAYVAGSTGYDISYPQCGGAYPGGAFGIVGVDGGYPFMHDNPCLADEYARTPHAALYINTGYDPLYTQVDGKHTTLECVVQSIFIKGSAAQKAAWGAGCSEASRSMAYATSQGASKPSGWWLDVETENSWSSTDLSLNQFTIQGIVDTLLRRTTAPVGVYSTGYQWRKIVGSLRVSGVNADWMATGRTSLDGVPAACKVGFSGAPVRFVQYLRGGFDTDYVC
jgi:hypothetical protein